MTSTSSREPSEPETETYCSASSVHLQDLVALMPTGAELDEAAAWVATQDASPEFPRFISEVIEHVRNHIR
jgi:hypothetical protein